MNILEKYLPERWFYRNVSLYEKYGLTNYAWNKFDIIDVIKILYERQAIILGGDLYIVKPNKS
ncbi:hypothetical protein FACS1894132_14390 [Clostridia bacterium]|nr:hypothetical protein FACS1894132_14390 [Clostridia bacterium]